MGLLFCWHTFGVPVILHCRFNETLVDRAQHGTQRIERGIEEHLMGLDLEGI